MNAQLGFAFLALIAIALSATPTDAQGIGVTNVQTIKVDFAHWMSKEGPGSKARTYRIRPCASLLLDATGYTFPTNKSNGKAPNSIRVSYGDFLDGFVYYLAWRPDNRRYELSAETLKPAPGAPPFRRFKQPFEYVISIGIREENGGFADFWVTLVEVK